MRIPLLALATLALLDCADSVGPGGDLPAGPLPITSIAFPASVDAGTFQFGSTDGSQGVTIGLRLRNSSGAPALVEHGACSVAVWLYRADAPQTEPVWQNFPRESVCIMIGYQRTIAPGGIYDIPGALLSPATLSPTLSPGQYLVRVVIRRQSASGDMQTIVLPADPVLVP